MLKKGFFYSCLIGCIAFLSAGFKPLSSENFDWFHLDKNSGVTYLYPSQKPNDYKNLNVPFTGRFFIGFKEAVAFRESQGKYKRINSLGYMGKYQFGKETLKTIGIDDSIAFLNSPKMQEKAFIALLSKNKWRLKRQINQFEGKIVGGVRITESGILAAAHLGGAGSVKRFLKSNGKLKCKDEFGTSVKVYLHEFGGYETQNIKANRFAKVK
jgi:hypothetical protein